VEIERQRTLQPALHLPVAEGIEGGDGIAQGRGGEKIRIAHALLRALIITACSVK